MQPLTFSSALQQFQSVKPAHPMSVNVQNAQKDVFTTTNAISAPKFGMAKSLYALNQELADLCKNKRTRPEQIRQIITGGADPKIITGGADPNGQVKGKTPLTLACYAGNLSVVQTLVEAGADIHLETTTSRPLDEAILGGHLPVVKYLLEKGVNANSLHSKYRVPPIATAASKSDKRTGLNIFNLLLEKGAKVDQTAGFWALVVAARSGNLEIAEKLLKRGVNPNKDVERTGELPLGAAAGKGDVKMIKFLLKKGANIDGKNTEGDTALMQATFSPHKDAIKALLDAGADKTIKNKYGRTASDMIRQSDRDNRLADMIDTHPGKK